MLKFDIKIEGDKVIIGALTDISAELTSAAGRGLQRIIRGVYAESKELTNGAGSAGEYRTSKNGKQYWVKRDSPVAAGGYPVPKRSAHLNRLLGFVDPGVTVESEGKTFTADLLTGIVFDSANYASFIHDGTGTSKKYGARPFLNDAVINFDQGGKMAEIMDQEIQKEIDKNNK